MRTNVPRHPLVTCLLLALTFLLLGSFWGCGSANTKSAQANTGPQVVQVAVATAERRDFPVYLSGLGNVQAWNTVSLKSRVDGQIVQIAFKEGEVVKQGQLLLVIDPRPYQVALEQAQAQLAKDQAYEFLFVVAPLLLRGGIGVPVNPIAIR